MSALKDIYSISFYHKFADIAETVLPSFNRKKFIDEIFNKDWKNKELKQRMRHTSIVLHQFLHHDFNVAATQIEEITLKLQQSKTTENILGFIFLPDYIEIYGLNHLETSVNTIEIVTQFISCEYAVRPFILKYKDDMIQQMIAWSKHKNHHVRRLASEGCRPRLPWAMGIPELKQKPEQILPLLENLKNDSSEYVRRSVANNLNDIAKDHPHIVIEIASKWSGISKETDALLKHGGRTLLKQGNVDILKHFGFANDSKFTIKDFKVITPEVKIGNDLVFAFTACNESDTKQLFRLEYAIYYLRQNGQLSKKVFKISERNFEPNEKTVITKKQSFKIITTRKFYVGQHKISIILNGYEKTNENFILIRET
jgi:3-methyladenine DNA glycosylase AlkC